MGGFGLLASTIVDLTRALTSPAAAQVFTWLLGAVFVWSAIPKLRRPALAAFAIADFGVIRRPRPVFGLLLGVVEAILAAALVVTPWFGAIVATALLWLFTALIARSLREGDAFACYCFGDGDDTLSRLTLVRTGTLAVMASLALISAPMIRPWISQETALAAVVAAALLGSAVLGRHLVRLRTWNQHQVMALTAPIASQRIDS